MTARARLEEGVSPAREVEHRWPLALRLVRLAGSLMPKDVAASRRIREEGVEVVRSVGDKSVLSHGWLGWFRYISANETSHQPRPLPKRR